MEHSGCDINVSVSPWIGKSVTDGLVVDLDEAVAMRHCDAVVSKGCEGRRGI